ncbi:MAG: hypothetical protein LBS54_06395 [Dysgonamonadaceae bacterium]|nr:hypothetical protein [Dysgonamonadaceae bacterium]
METTYSAGTEILREIFRNDGKSPANYERKVSSTTTFSNFLSRKIHSVTNFPKIIFQLSIKKHSL